jgi:hypothetical protein
MKEELEELRENENLICCICRDANFLDLEKVMYFPCG